MGYIIAFVCGVSLIPVPSIAEFGLRDAGIGGSRETSRNGCGNSRLRGSNDCVKDPMTAKDAICVENQAGCAIDSLRGKVLKHSGQAIVTDSSSGGIMSIFLDPYRLRRVAMLAPW